MTQGQEAASSALQQSASENRMQVEMANESRVLLASLLRDEMRIAVAEGIAAAMTDENAERFWKKGFEVAQSEAKKRLRDGAGDLAIGAVRGLFKWASMVVLLIAFAYYIGGWSLAKAIWTAITKG